MKMVTLEVRSLSVSLTDFAHAWKTGEGDQTARISFETPELLWKVLTAKRWELLKAMAGHGPMTIREAARRVERDVKAVHGDVRALLNAGVIDHSEDGRHIVFPYDAVHVDFMLNVA